MHKKYRFTNFFFVSNESLNFFSWQTSKIKIVFVKTKKKRKNMIVGFVRVCVLLPI